jgi:hypothetical protein
MLSLHEMQTGFAAALFDAGASRQAPGIRADGISPAIRLGFYRANVFENYRKALRLTYPAVEKLVGHGFFDGLAKEYIRRYPSHSGDVGRHGEQFAEFLRHHASVQELPYLTDVARLEWCLEESFNEQDVQPLPLQRLASVPEEHYQHLRFLLAPSCRLMSSDFPVNRIWDVCQPTQEGQGDVDLREGGVDLLIHRQGFSVTVQALRPGEFTLLVALSIGCVFSEAYDHAHSVDSTFDTAEFLQKTVQSGVLVDFTLAAEVYAP